MRREGEAAGGRGKGRGEGWRGGSGAGMGAGGGRARRRLPTAPLSPGEPPGVALCHAASACRAMATLLGTRCRAIVARHCSVLGEGAGACTRAPPPPPIAVIRPLRRQASPPSLPLALPRAPVADSWKHTLRCSRVRAGGRQVAVADLRGNKQRRNVSRVRRLHSAARRAVFSWAPHAPPPGRRGGGWDGRMTTAERQVAGGGRAAAGSRAEGVAGVS